MEFLKEWILFGWRFLTNTVGDWGDGVLLWLMGLLPDVAGVPSIVDAFGQFYGIVDAWVPFGEAFLLWSALQSVRASLVVLRWILKFIPFVG